ncbi:MULTISPECIES: hypothetical protein [unclassified Bradyrhizobium]|uniref:hypothetical protein n=1 Tax=unclassified Bradyrhizobium TaxID=2631580 RepID=UPI00244A7E34|nr:MULTISPECIES: hypothetical protein [unclassified Bradyrhizobium]MDH2345109.1 hypothetical protein [Bradyrhizobium sp. SSUT77]MDH2355023.1 hypothetical protein [Bradyrhizobium sp. SSUT112]
MKHPRIAAFALTAILAASSLAGSAQYAPASAGNLDWLSNQKYVDCLKGISFLSNWNNGQPSTQAQKDAAYDRGRRYCNRQNFPNRPGTDY